jgi:hypothetical protein
MEREPCAWLELSGSMSAVVHAAIFNFTQAAHWTCIGGYVFVTPKGVLVEMKPAFENQWHICLIVTPRESRKNGHASEALRRIVGAADEAGAVISLIATPSKGCSIRQRDLVKWYARNGFIQEQHSSTMVRQPRKR